ncbi:glycosyltransferase [Myxosarcina sp. GI1]|uniref:glycosyltransferase n=1 Tax=Myxosarcina sp. GI1 TaxID=1541065 RepID=UPI00055DFB76|nr:glycosyltransferase [Myxosarcina sp. GI1]
MNYAASRSGFHLWFPNIFEFKGGIQVYSAFLLEALQKIYPQQSYDVFLKHDTRFIEEINFLPQTRFHFSGKWTAKLRTLMFACQLIGYGLWQRPKIVLATHLNFAVAAYWLKRLSGIPYWTVAHGVDAWDIKNPTLQNALKSADRILAVSSYTRDRLIAEQNLDPKRISLLPNTFDASRFKIASKPQYLLERYHLTKEQPVILTVARLDSLERAKGYDQIIQVLPQIRAFCPDVRYIIAGKGRDRPRLERLIAELKLQDCVTLAGFVPDEELNDHYNLCDVFAMPSKGEGFGIVYLEALACGKPTLGGNRDGAVDALCNGELGVLVDPDDLGEISQTLISILQRTHPHSLIYQPETLRQKVIEEFGFARFQTRLARLLQTHAKEIG